MASKALRADLRELAGAENFEDLFRDSLDNRYRIPPFQREYAWKKSQVEDLFDDLKDFRETSDSGDLYLLGQIILAGSDDPIYSKDLIDGQQRFVSMTLLFLAMQFFFKKHSKPGEALESDPGVKSAIKKIDSMLSFVEDTREYRRIEVQEGAKEAYRGFVEGHVGPRDTDPSASNMWVNLRLLRTRVLEEISPQDGLDFFEFLVSRVVAVRVALRRDDEAIDFFEKMNDRGVRLSATDLMKNLLFQKFSVDAYKDAHGKWTRSVRDLQKLGEGVPNGMPFLLKALLTQHVEHRVSASKIYREWKPFIRNSQEANQFFEDVGSATKYLDALTQRAHSAGAAIDAARYLDSKQFWIPVLATRDFPEKVASQVCRFISSRTVLSLLVEEQSQVFERPLSPWANQIWNLGKAKGTKATYSDFQELSRTKEVEESGQKLLDLLHLKVRDLSYTNGTRKVRLVLALASIELEKILHTDLSDQPLSVYLNTDVYDIDHIYPSGRVGKTEAARDLDERADLLGNLALLHYPKNRSAGKGLPAAKVDKYFDQTFALSKSLAWPENEVQKIIDSGSGDIAKLRKHSTQLEEWSSESMRMRADLYSSLLLRGLSRDMGIS